ncbi:ABC transporter ATP-binding protein [Dyella mobilis]|uniref:ABC transporter ATP-binding protein n=1 Tax=Dyella mobilis TaxID=1849582 RepID=A0ABS2KDM7_9GAMM|nr:ABC transporter ATP-binding protein [Dyella mobilis]MBM7128877.1 ABC transporter ATP-binding protein [Dyella mobilis]GLQ99433.1 ABC transporter ATP-binding protein [Dyella mobilis]
MTDDPIIETRGLSRRYGRVEAVRDLSFTVERGQITGFLGRNGAGKSTTIKMLLGMIRPTAGTGRVLGYDIDDPVQSVQIRRRIAYVGEDKGLYGYMSVGELIRFTRSFYPDWQPQIEARLLQDYQLPLGRKVKAISKGMRTKLALLLALARRPELIILDEPSEGLDPVSIEELLQALQEIRAGGTSVFFSSHQLSEVEQIADRVLMIDHGRLVMDTLLSNLLNNYRNITVEIAAQEPMPAFSLAGVERTRVTGRQARVLASSNVEGIVDYARALSATVQVTPVNLREVFLDMVRDTT